MADTIPPTPPGAIPNLPPVSDGPAAVPTTTVSEKSVTTITTDTKPPWLTADGHVNISSIVGIICALGVIWGPVSLKDQFTATGIAAAGWLGASAKAK